MKYLNQQLAVLSLLVALPAATASAQATHSVVADFDGTDGSTPLGGLSLGSDGNYYGTTTIGSLGLLLALPVATASAQGPMQLSPISMAQMALHRWAA